MVNLWLIMVNNWNNNISGWWFGTMEFYDFPYGNFIIPTDELIFFRGVGEPPTSNMYIYNPIGSMYGIYANIGGILMVNVAIYNI